jgi:hypothetical protein
MAFRKLENFDITPLDSDLQAVPPQFNLGPGNATLYIGIDSTGAFWANGIKITGGLVGANFVDTEIPSGAINGVNTIFTLAHTPSPSGSLQLFRNGLLQQAGGGDYALATNTITFTTAPVSTDTIIANYRF